MLTEKNRDEFYRAADSLKRFKRAEIKDEQERSLIETLYTDLLPENQVFKMILSDSTTFLVGRKGTGKSTIILRLESEYRKKMITFLVILIQKLYLRVRRVNIRI